MGRDNKEVKTTIRGIFPTGVGVEVEAEVEVKVEVKVEVESA